MRTIDAIGRTDVKKIAVDKDRAVRRVLTPDVQIVNNIELPNNIGIACLQRDRRSAGAGDEAAFVAIRAVVAVGQPMDVEADDLATIGHQVDAVAVNGRRRADSEAHIVEIELGEVGFEFRHDQLPEQPAGGLVKAHYQPTMCRSDSWVAEVLVVGADVDAAIGDGRCTTGLRAEPGNPLHVLRRAEVDARALRALLAGNERLRQSFLVGNHVAIVAAAPARPVRSLKACSQ